MMNGKKVENEKTDNHRLCSSRNSNLYIYIAVLVLLLCSRIFDIYTTYLATPDLSGESNFLVRYLGFGWTNLSVMNLGIIAVFFLLFAISWSEFSKRRENDQVGSHLSIGGFVTRNADAEFEDPIETEIMQRNVAYEIGITLPVYVIITGYFQGAVNLMIYFGVIVVSFTHSQFLYPVTIGGVFGIISHYFAKRLLYSKHEPLSEKPHKVMVSQKT
jgi:hypothetical protein